MADCLISPVKEIGKCILTQCLWPPIKSHFDYWWCFHNNIQGLSDQVRELDRQIYDLTQKIGEARLRLEIVRPGVEEWLKASTGKLAEARRILPGDNIPKACNLISRYSLGKNANKTAEEIAKLRNDGDFNPIADPAPPAAMGFTPHRSTMDFQSRKHIEEEIIKSLKESNVDMIGICGMGGVGKTTTAQRIRKRVKDENLFDEVVMVTVSQKIDKLKIQEEIAEWLKLKFDDKYLSTRAATLRTRLMDPKRKIIILDDVWESLELDHLGVPFESERCKILLTTRSKDVCKKMEVQKIIAMEILTEEEAWILFKDKAGDCVEDSILLSMAKDVVAECKGLPIALVTVGKFLQNQKRKSIWVDSLSQLKLSNPADFPEVLKHVYKPLKLSYDFLHNSEQYLLLLCCLFPEDYNIPVEVLTWYSMGLRLFNDITNIEEARNRTFRLVENLKSRFLLIDGDEDIQVKMHDVVRDVAIYIGSKEKNGFLKSLHRTSIENSSDVNCNWMSVDISNERMEVPVLSRFPKLRLLMLSSNEFYNIPHISFEGMEELNVLSFQRISIGSIPPKLGSLANLQTLRLFDCKVENISVIGKLTGLKILSCYGCHNIREFPAEIGRLKGLRLLELNRCHNLQRIPFGIISSLFLLEELKILRSFSEWEAEENGKERRNASLTELGSLPNLTCLEIEIDDCTLSTQEICLSQNLVKYYIGIGSKYDYYLKEREYEKIMSLYLPSHIGAVGKWIQMQVRNTEGLFLKGDGSVSNNFNVAEIKNLRNLRVDGCSTMKKLVETKDSSKFGIVFPWLEILRLEGLGNLQEICHLNQNAFLYNLKSIKIESCPKLRSLFSASVAKTCLLQLEVLDISHCDAMEQVFWDEVRDDNTGGCIEFPKLKKLTLLNLPNLTAFCQGLENIIIKFPNLTEMSIVRLRKLNSLSPPLKDVSFCNLKSINIFQCHNLRSLFSVSATRRCLLQLELLWIGDCAAMEQVFWNEGTDDDDTDGCIEFPKLKELTFKDLPNLTAFCHGLENTIFKFPNLTQMSIGDLPKLNSLCPLNSETLNQNTCSHLFCNPKVETGSLKNLIINNIGDNIKNIWCHQILNKDFNNLQILRISSMHGIRSLMSTSIAKNLVSLKVLHIKYCIEMVEVIERDDDDKQVVDINSLFPTLKSLSIICLPKLRTFWQWNHAWELPFLEDVCNYSCPMMETLTLGSINTPNIKMINYTEIDDQKDLNDVIRRIWIKSQDTFTSDEDANDNENENKDESDGSQDTSTYYWC